MTGQQTLSDNANLLRIGTREVPSRVVLAPLSGITDLPFRRQVRRFGPQLVVTEMVASAERCREHHESVRRAAGTGDVEPLSVQLVGREPYWMGEAARLVEAQGAQLIDINMGCPARKVVGGQSGSALMREPDLALEIIGAVVGAVSVPVTLKMRTGWDDDNRNAPDLARRAQDAGIQMITIHGRTRCQFYEGRADWAFIAKVKDAVDVPVLANGDILDEDDAESCLAQSGAHGVMVGRGAQGQPWLLRDIDARLRGEIRPKAPMPLELRDIILTHYEETLSHYGRKVGVRVMRKHFNWYLERFPEMKEVRSRICREDDPNLVRRLIIQAFACLDSSGSRPSAPSAQAA